jgi:hypothetical protein
VITKLPLVSENDNRKRGEHTMSTARTPNPDAAPETTRGEIVHRAESWLRQPVPFNGSRFHHNEHGIYRADDAGYVSMAWGLPGIPPDRHGGLDLAGLTAISRPIPVADLLAGDLVVADTRVALFHEWADAARTACWVFEQAPGTGTVHRLVQHHTRLEARRHPRLAR